MALLIESSDARAPTAASLVPTETLRRVVYQFFHALLNIKHLGSIDRIAQGLNHIAKVMSTAR